MNYRNYVFLLIIFLCFVGLCIFSLKEEDTFVLNDNITVKNYYEGNKNNEVVISAVGDCTIGTDTNYRYKNSFNYVYEKVKDYSYFFSGVQEVLGNDDITIANLESVLSDNANVKNPKTYNYKGPAHYVNILKEGSVELVNIANNHTFDYLEKGYKDTINALENAEIEYFGYENYRIIEINNIRIAIIGILGWNYGDAKKDIDKAMEYLGDMNVDLKLFNFHWGEMRTHQFNETQEKIGKYAIDKGADLVIGHHSHVLQGIEKYKGKYIAYSLGNFVYGGILYPYDSDSVILQMKFTFNDEKKIVKIHAVDFISHDEKIFFEYDWASTDNYNMDFVCQAEDMCNKWLYEPNSCLMKCACWGELLMKFPNLIKIHANTHLFVSEVLYEGFPGRVKKILGVYSNKSKELSLLKGQYINIVCRNYGESVANVKKRFKTNDGGNRFIYCCRYSNNKSAILLVE